MYLVKFKIFLIFFIFLFSSSAFAEEVLTIDLKSCIERVIRFHPELGEYKKDTEIYKAKVMQAESAALPQIELMAVGGPSPKAEKEAISPQIRTDIKSTTIDGVFGLISMQMLMPIYTFGKISAYKTAAQGGVKFSKAELEKKRSELILKTKELYWSLALARDLRLLAKEIKDELEKALKKTEEDLKRDIPLAEELTLYKLKTYLGEVKRNLNEIDKNEAVLIEVMKFMMGIPLTKQINIITPSLKYEEVYFNKEEMIRKAFSLRPEMTQIQEGLKAKEALVNAEKSNQYPQIFLLLKGSLSSATNRDRIHNPYISDPLNSSYLAIVLGMKLNIDFGITKSKIREAQLEYEKILEKKKLAEQGIPIQITKAYLEYLEASKTAKDMEEAYQNAKKWLVVADANFDMGIGEIKDLADAVLTYATTRVNHLKALYSQKIAIATLLQASGLDKDER
jgi:outer membrane protein TolC